MIYYLLFGSNIPPRERYISRAKLLLQQQGITIIAESSIYETAAWGNTEQGNFLNQAVKVLSDLPPLQMLAVVKKTETDAGRKKRTRWGEREIDIDILMASCGVYQNDELVIPHPYLHLRRFALTPFAEIAGNETHPLLLTEINNLLKHCDDGSAVELYTSK